MPHCRAVPPHKTVEVDHGITLTENSSVNIDVTAPLAKEALEANKIEKLDETAAPKFAKNPEPGETV